MQWNLGKRLRRGEKKAIHSVYQFPGCEYFYPGKHQAIKITSLNGKLERDPEKGRLERSQGLSYLNIELVVEHI